MVERMRRHWLAIPLSWRMLALFLVFEFFAAGRVYVEMQVLTDNDNLMTAFHRFLWYTYVFLFFAACYRRILGAPFGKLMYLALGGAILFIPPLYALAGGHQFSMNYLVSRDPAEIAREMLTLHYGHEKNFLMFPELLTLLLGTVGISWYFSRSIPKTLLNTAVAFYGAFLSAGLCWFSVEPKHDAVFRLDAMFHAQQFYAFQFLSGVILLSLILFLPELLAWARGALAARRGALAALLVAALYAALSLLIAPRHDRPLAAADLAVLFLPLLCCSFAPLIAADAKVPAAAKIYAAWSALFAFALLAGAFWSPAQMILRR